MLVINKTKKGLAEQLKVHRHTIPNLIKKGDIQEIICNDKIVGYIPLKELSSIVMQLNMNQDD